MIIEYHRPNSINEALALLARKNPQSYPLGGGTVLNRPVKENYAVVDLQSLGLGGITKKGNILQLGATVTLQELSNFPGLPDDLYKAILNEATYNLRQIATLAGTLVTATGRSPLLNVLLGLDSGIEIQSFESEPLTMKLGDWLPLRALRQTNKLITMITLPNAIHLAYEYIARTPADQPIVSTVVTQWNSGRTRLTLGGWGNAPILAMDGTSSEGIDIAARQAYSDVEDEWASAEYRQEMVAILALRCIKRIIQEKNKSSS